MTPPTASESARAIADRIESEPNHRRGAAIALGATTIYDLAAELDRLAALVDSGVAEMDATREALAAALLDAHRKGERVAALERALDGECLDCRDTANTARKLGWNDLPDDLPDAHGDAGGWLGREVALLRDSERNNIGRAVFEAHQERDAECDAARAAIADLTARQDYADECVDALEKGSAALSACEAFTTQLAEDGGALVHFPEACAAVMRELAVERTAAVNARNAADEWQTFGQFEANKARAAFTELSNVRQELTALRTYLTRSIAEDIGGMEEATGILGDLAAGDAALLVAWANAVRDEPRELAAIRAYLEAFATDNAPSEMAVLTEGDQDLFAAYVRALCTPYIEEADELTAALENERGEGEPTSDGWEWSDVTAGWTRVDDTDEPGCPNEVTITQGDHWSRESLEKRAWHYWLNGEPRPDLLPAYPTARQAMRAADLARIGK